MFTIGIIGTGQLGSRHLQGIHKSKYPLDIWVIDSSKDSLTLAEERYYQIGEYDRHHVHFEESLDKLPLSLDLVIVATGSKPRFEIIRQLLEHHKVKYLILEKFLFPSLKEYEWTSELIALKEVKTYVNCPRRIYPSYQYIESVIDKSLPIKMTVKGTDWGLCCNSIHYIDIFMNLCGETSFNIDTKNLIPEFIASKRNGYVELNGSLAVGSANGSKLTLVSYPKSIGSDTSIKIVNDTTEIEFNEITGSLRYNGQKLKFKTPFQSELTGIYVDNIIEGKPLYLTSFEESKKYHMSFLKALLKFQLSLTGQNEDYLPIT